VPDRNATGALEACGVNLQVVLAEDSGLDAAIKSEDPENDLVKIPGYSSILDTETTKDWPLVWFPLLGENRLGQLQKVLDELIPPTAEICPILPHPSSELQRADRLLIEHRTPLFESRQTPISNVIYVDESNPFEVYRQLVGAMKRYRKSMALLDGCRLIVTPLSSKLATIGAALACFEMRPQGVEAQYGVGIPYAAPTRYSAQAGCFDRADPEVCTLILTGHAYSLN
jgi:hypothetical protein